MDINILKESNIEYCENMYALSMNYLKIRDNIELRKSLDAMDKLEANIRICNDISELNKYINSLNILFDRIEVIINE